MRGSSSIAKSNMLVRQHAQRDLPPQRQGAQPSDHSIKVNTTKGRFGAKAPRARRQAKPAGLVRHAQQAGQPEEAEKVGLEKTVTFNVGSASIPTAQSNKPGDAGAFGITADQFADGDTRALFRDFHKQAADRHAEKVDKNSNLYANTFVTYTDAEGNLQYDLALEKIKPSRAEKLAGKLLTKQTEAGKKIQTGLNKVGSLARETTGRKRKTGSNYGNGKAHEGVLDPAKLVPHDHLAAVANGGRGADLGVGFQQGQSLGVTGGNDGLANLGTVMSIVDAAAAVQGSLKLVSERQQAKDNLNFKSAAQRFVNDPVKATADDAGKFVKFMEAGAKLFKPTLEDESTRKASEALAARSVAAVPLSAVQTGLEVANTFMSVDPLASTFLAPLATGLGVLEGVETKHDLTRQRNRGVQAELCKKSMADVMEKASPDHADHALAESLVDCFTRHQERLIIRAARDERFAVGHLTKVGASVALSVGVPAMIGALVGFGALTLATGGAALAVPAAVAVGYSAAAARMGHQRAHAAHTAKWRQRMAQVVALETPRDDLEATLIGGKGAVTSIRFTQEEGEYAPDDVKERVFAGDRELELEARDNEYVGLRILALKIQDLIKGGAVYDEGSPLMQLVKNALGIDSLLLMAICKAAEPMKPEQQLDFIQARLAPKLGIKFSVVGGTETQAPIHPSVFLRHFRTAVSNVPRRLAEANDESLTFGKLVQQELETIYSGHSQEGMRAFNSAIKTFLEETKDRPQTKFTKLVGQFSEYLLAQDKFERLSEKQRIAIEKRVANQERKIDSLIQEIEKQADAMRSRLIRA